MRPGRLLAYTGIPFVLLAAVGCGTVTSDSDGGSGSAGSGAAGTGSGAADTGAGSAGTGSGAGGTASGTAGTGIGSGGGGMAGTAVGGRGGSGIGGSMVTGAGGSDRVGGRGGTSATGAAGTGSGTAGTGSGAAGTGSGAGGMAGGGRGGGGGTAAGGRGGTLGTGGISTGGRGGGTACPAGGCPALAITDLIGISTVTASGFDAPGFRCKSLTICAINGSCVYFSNDMFGSKQSGEDAYQDAVEAAVPMPIKMAIDAGAASQCNNPPVTLRATDYVTLTIEGGKQVAVYLPAFTGASLTLYIASDGSTYYDAARTMPAGKPPTN